MNDGVPASRADRHYHVPDLVARIADELRRAGLDPSAVTRDDLASFDEFHTGGRDSTRELARLAGIEPAMRVLDVGSGVGGPARTLAAEHGASVTGLDLTEEFCHAARYLTGLVGLVSQAAFCQGDALAMPFADGTFDVVWSQNAVMNVANKKALYQEMFRVLKPGGRLALEAAFAGPVPGLVVPTFWASSTAISHLQPPEQCREMLTEVGFQELVWEDMTETIPARDRLARAIAAPPRLGRGVIVADRVAEKMESSARNLSEGHVVMARGVWRKG